MLPDADVMLPRIDYSDTDFALFAGVKELIRVLKIIRGSFTILRGSQRPGLTFPCDVLQP